MMVQQVVQDLPQQLGAGPAEDPFGSGVGERDPAVGVHHENGVGGTFGDQFGNFGRSVQHKSRAELGLGVQRENPTTLSVFKHLLTGLKAWRSRPPGGAGQTCLHLLVTGTPTQARR
ncbi:MAG TPA: hypothetical protein VIL09_03185 [Microvirga sp.]